MPEKISAGGLLQNIKETFGLGKKPQAEAAVVPQGVEPQPVTPVADEAPPVSPIAEVPAPPAVVVESVPATPEGLLDWLRGEEEAVAPAPAPLPEPATPPSPIVEVPVAPAPEVEVSAPGAERAEVDPFASLKEFNGHLENVKSALATLAGGAELSAEQKKQALIAAARANSLLPKLPGELLNSVLLMRAVASGNPNFGRDDFQREMLAAVDSIRAGAHSKG